MVGWINWALNENAVGRDKIEAIGYNQAYDSAGGSGVSIAALQSRQGALYLPATPLTTEGEIYWHAIAAYGGMLNRSQILNYPLAPGTGSYPSAPNSIAWNQQPATRLICAFNTSKSYLYESGSAVNANRQATINWAFNASPTGVPAGGVMNFHILAKVRRIVNISLESAAILQ